MSSSCLSISLTLYPHRRDGSIAVRHLSCLLLLFPPLPLSLALVHRDTTGPTDPRAMARMDAADILLKWIQATNGQVLVEITKLVEDKRESETSLARVTSTVFGEQVKVGTGKVGDEGSVRNPWDAMVAANGRASVGGPGRKREQQKSNGGGGSQDDDGEKNSKKGTGRGRGGGRGRGRGGGGGSGRGSTGGEAPPIGGLQAQRTEVDRGVDRLLEAACMMNSGSSLATDHYVPQLYRAPNMNRMREERDTEGRENRDPLSFYGMTTNGYRTSGSIQPLLASSGVLPCVRSQYEEIQERMRRQQQAVSTHRPYSWM